MSAFICSDEHIRQMAMATCHRSDWGHLSYHFAAHGIPFEAVDVDEAASQIANVLMEENVRSVNYRYDDQNDPDLIEVTLSDIESRVSEPVWLLKMCQCYEYQAGETPDYGESLAAVIVNSIRMNATRALPGYDDAPCWDYTGERAKQRDLISLSAMMAGRR